MTLLLYRNGREAQVIHKKKGRRSLERDLGFIGVFGPILHRCAQDAATGGNGMVWGRWERGEQGNEAVFHYSTHSDHPGYEIVRCCLRNKETFPGRSPISWRAGGGSANGGNSALDDAVGTGLDRGAKPRSGSPCACNRCDGGIRSGADRRENVHLSTAQRGHDARPGREAAHLLGPGVGGLTHRTRR